MRSCEVARHTVFRYIRIWCIRALHGMPKLYSNTRVASPVNTTPEQSLQFYLQALALLAHSHTSAPRHALLHSRCRHSNELHKAVPKQHLGHHPTTACAPAHTVLPSHDLAAPHRRAAGDCTGQDLSGRRMTRRNISPCHILLPRTDELHDTVPDESLDLYFSDRRMT